MQAYGATSRRPGEGVHRQLARFDGHVAAVTRFSRRRAAEDSGGSFERETTALKLAANGLANRSEVHVERYRGRTRAGPSGVSLSTRSVFPGSVGRHAWCISWVRV